ncbi:MAG TPA: hypothetical protein VFU16_06160 [Solirubrobacterales bacterium]|nr:hypothetical protein [Solirubrobacterales bacterium]
MLQRFRDRFGTAGLVIAVVALIAALAGTAIAAGGALSPKQKKEVTKIAKKYAGEDGAPGAKGDKGDKGDTGAAGNNGNNGNNGADGKSVEVENAPVAKCPEGGAVFKVGGVEKGKACNGAEGPQGEPGTYGDPLPAEKTLTGTWGGQQPEGFFIESISFATPVLTGAVTPVYVGTSNAEKTQGATEGCKGPDANGVPQADPGKLCVYHNSETGTVGNEPAEIGFFDPREQFGLAFGVAPTGTVLGLFCKAPTCLEFGTWAVTAPNA